MQEETGVLPEALKKRPTLDQETLHYYGIWKQLAGSRNHSFGGPEPIPFSEVFMWASAHGYHIVEVPELWENVRRVDNAWLAESIKFRKAQQEKPA